MLGSASFLGYKLINLANQTPSNLNKETVENNITISSNIEQFYPNMRFNHNNILYEFSNNCNEERKERMKKAFSVLQEKTKIILFQENKDKADIIISCTEEDLKKEENVFIAGEGGPSKFINSTVYPLILEGKIFLYQNVNCKSPLLELHEILHTLGFKHLNKKDSVMYPYSDCSQELGEEYISYLKELYSIQPTSDIYFEKANISIKGNYLNLELELRNKGNLDANSITLEVYADSKKIKDLELLNMNAGEGKTLSVENILLPSSNPKEIKLIIKYDVPEFDKANNIATANF